MNNNKLFLKSQLLSKSQNLSLSLLKFDLCTKHMKIVQLRDMHTDVHKYMCAFLRWKLDWFLMRLVILTSLAACLSSQLSRHDAFTRHTG
ncbi:hypothetical protein GQX74_007317 [Glossina fuscipes]|nr:hypothetical protein GQX74_007317 [Glossina fuscipes]